MKPFEFSGSLAEISDQFPRAEQLLSVMRCGEDADRLAVARQWLSEGIPYAFRKCPAVYESLRGWLSLELQVEAKAISLTGSARLGSALSSRKCEFGKPFGPDSDLDLFVVSVGLFESMCDDFSRWSADFRQGEVSPNNRNERKYWCYNLDEGLINIESGFINSWRVPNHGRYGNFKKINQTLSDLSKKIEGTEQAPYIAKTSLRCYNSWQSFERQTLLNFNDIVKGMSDEERLTGKDRAV